MISEKQERGLLGSSREERIRAQGTSSRSLLTTTHEQRVAAIDDCRRALGRGDRRAARELFECYVLIAGHA